MTKHTKVKLTSSEDKGLTVGDKAEMVFMIFFLILLGATIFAFVTAGIRLLTEVI